jgi:cytoskeletal protein RodZ
LRKSIFNTMEEQGVFHSNTNNNALANNETTATSKPMRNRSIVSVLVIAALAAVVVVVVVGASIGATAATARRRDRTNSASSASSSRSSPSTFPVRYALVPAISHVRL